MYAYTTVILEIVRYSPAEFGRFLGGPGTWF